MSEHIHYPSENNLDIVNGYEKYLIYKTELTTLLNNEHCRSCDKCLKDVMSRLKECDDNNYTLNLKSYEQNPFFLGYSSTLYKGILVDGDL